MSVFVRRAPVEGGWALDGRDGAGAAVRLVFGETELARAYLGLTVGRHPALNDRVVDCDAISKRHCRLGVGVGGLFVEDLHSLNGTWVDGERLAPFQPRRIGDGARVGIGRITLAVVRLAEDEGRR